MRVDVWRERNTTTTKTDRVLTRHVSPGDGVFQEIKDKLIIKITNDLKNKNKRNLDLNKVLERSEVLWGETFNVLLPREKIWKSFIVNQTNIFLLYFSC